MCPIWPWKFFPKEGRQTGWNIERSTRFSTSWLVLISIYIYESPPYQVVKGQCHLQMSWSFCGLGSLQRRSVAWDKNSIGNTYESERQLFVKRPWHMAFRQIKRMEILFISLGYFKAFGVYTLIGNLYVIYKKTTRNQRQIAADSQFPLLSYLFDARVILLLWTPSMTENILAGSTSSLSSSKRQWAAVMAKRLPIWGGCMPSLSIDMKTPSGCGFRLLCCRIWALLTRIALHLLLM